MISSTDGQTVKPCQGSEQVGQILLGDCVEMMQGFPSESVDLIVTDPPYVRSYVDRAGRIIPNKGFKWINPAFSQMFRLLKSNSFCICHYGWVNSRLFLNAWHQAGLRVVGHLIWVKSYPSNRKYLKYCHDTAYLLAKGTPPVPKETISDTRSWKFSGNKRHPSEQHESTSAPLIRQFSKPGDTVLDPFMGSGAIIASARNLGRQFIGIEIHPEYFKAAKDRLGGIHGSSRT